MILIGLGANLPHVDWGSPRETCDGALEELCARGVAVLRRSRWYQSAPVPPSDQPWYVNGVAAVATDLDPVALLAVLHRIEEEFGRIRRVRNAARTIDLDLLAYGELVHTQGAPPLLPHPRLHTRAFVLLPLAEVAPAWRHPVLGKTVTELIALLPAGHGAAPLE